MISEWNNFSNSESLCRCDASHQVLAQSDLRFWEKMSFEEFQDGRHGSHLGYRNGTILAILNHCDASNQVSAQSDLGFGRCHLKNFKMVATLDIGAERF